EDEDAEEERENSSSPLSLRPLRPLRLCGESSSSVMRAGVPGKRSDMACRKWIVRGLVFGVATVMITGAVLYYQWTNPAAIRELVIDRLTGQFVGVRVNVESAYLRLLGGISVSEIRLTRKDDPEQTEFLYIPSAVIY